MSKLSGCRIDDFGWEVFELTYFGDFQLGISSQTIDIRSLEDLKDIRDHIDKQIQEVDNGKS